MTTRCSMALLETALTGNLSADEEHSLHCHLEDCEQCVAALERMAGGPAWCQEAAALLVEDELDVTLPTTEKWSDVDFTVEHLEPADEPNVLGRLGGYDVLEVIGHGGMGIVLKGYDRELKRCVAIKVLAPHLARSPLAKKRFAREAQAAAAVVHPHVLAIHQVQPSGRLPFLVMPLVAGESLAERLAAQGTLELKEILRIGMQAAAGLAAAHEQGLVHRDVKPANILLEKGIERAVLTDFGLARAADDVTLTRWGVIAGTPQYMSPEQARGEPLDGRSDLFGLGCILYEMATGVSPFRADSLLATMRRLVDDSPQAMASLNPELPPWFIAIVKRLLEKDPARRFGSAQEVSELLEGCLAHVQQPANVPLPAGLPVGKRGRLVTRIAGWRRPARRIGALVALLLLGIGGITAFMMATAESTDISGQWQDEEWGRVVLTQVAPGEYTGTYTRTDSGNPANKTLGKIDVRWSRIERRYNGTWSEGPDRFGTLSLRATGDNIRGAWTTDPESKVAPGIPALADLAWVRYQSSGFEPVIERTLFANEMLHGCFLDLDSGKILSPPRKLIDSLSSDAKRSLKNGALGIEVLREWMKESGADVVARICPGKQIRIASLTQVDGFGPLIGENGGAERSDFNDITAEMLSNWLAETEKVFINTTEIKKWNYALSGVYSFKTREGRIGILETVSATPTSVTLRYKLLQANIRQSANAATTDLDGTWRLESVTGKGIRGFEHGLTARIQGNRWTMIRELKNSQDKMELGTNKDGATIDLTSEDDSRPPIVWRGLYWLRGDTLTIAWGSPTSVRPTDFDGVDGGIHTWKRISREVDAELGDAPAKAVSGPSPIFGPVIERVVNDDDTPAQKDSFINFDTGQLLSPPAYIKDPFTRMRWLFANGADAEGRAVEGIRGLQGLSLQGLGLIPIPTTDEQWDCTPEDLRKQLADVKWEWEGLQRLGDFMSGREKLPATFFIQTDAGAQGVLQITDFVDEPPGVKIRYKLLNNSVHNSNAGSVGEIIGSDEQSILGEWQVVSAETGGRKAPDAEVRDMKWTISKDEIRFAARGRKRPETADQRGENGELGPEQEFKWSYKLDSSKEPKWIDIVQPGEAPNLGIYELKGDRLTICYPEGPEQRKGIRSTAFESKDGSPNDVLVVLERIKPFPKGAHIGSNKGSVLVVHDDFDVHYVFYYPGEINTSSRGSQNSQGMTWRDEGSITRKDGKTLGYSRESTDPFHLVINGKEYDLLRGRVFELHDDAGVEQRMLFPATSIAKSPEAVAKLIATARKMDSEPATQEKLTWQLEVAQSRLRDLLKTHSQTHPLVQQVRESIVRLRADMQKIVPNARQAVEAYVAAALAGDVEEASKFVTGNELTAVNLHVKEWHTKLPVKSLKIADVRVNDAQSRGFAVSEVMRTIEPLDNRHASVVIFRLVRLKGNWLIELIDPVSEAKAEQELQRFLRENTDAVEIGGAKQESTDSTQSRPQVDPPQKDAAFGPVIERTVNDDSPPQLKDIAIDFDSGKVLTFPEENNQDLGKGFKWAFAHSVDATGRNRGLMAFDMIAVPASNEQWDCTPEFLQKQLTGSKSSFGDMMGKDDKLPATYFIQTSEGRQGILQITGSKDDPPGVKIRYKLLRKDDRGADADSKGEKHSSDYQNILGKWEVVSVQGQGGQFMSLSDQSKPGEQLLIAHVAVPNGVLWLSEKFRRTSSRNDSLHLYPDTNPPRITYKARGATANQFANHFLDTNDPPDFAIYRIDGDELTILAGEPQDFRVNQGTETVPTTFRTEDGETYPGRPATWTWKFVVPNYAKHFRLEEGRRQILVKLRRVAASDETMAVTLEPPAKLPHVVPFEVGASQFREGNGITIEEVRGTANTIKPGNTYEITGTYRLTSVEKATLTASLTFDPNDQNARGSSAFPRQLTYNIIDRGNGRFSLTFYVWRKGKPYIMFYPVAGGGDPIGKIYFGTGDSVLKKGPWEKSTKKDADATPAESDPPGDENEAKKPDAAAFSHVVPFEVGASQSREGDRITIEEVRGTADTIEAGNTYVIEGTYRLSSAKKASLSAFVTVDANDSDARRFDNVPTQRTQSKLIDQGEGRFSLVLYMWCQGKPHISFYPAEGGDGFGGVYFGTGDSVLKKGEGEKSSEKGADKRRTEPDPPADQDDN